jgi:NADH:ubiquinone oxidoreductase subunit 5 (subunit L)/multisubunit Na+/H+ antiporter MnhA subunit
MRVLSLTFLKKPLMNKVIASHAHEPYYTMTGPLFFLSICSIFIGYVLKDMMVGLGTDF